MTYCRDGKWFFSDESYDEHGPYKNRTAAEKDLKAYCYWLDHGPTLWQHLWWPSKRAFK